MARLTNRPSIASSRLSSVASEAQFDQENMDPTPRRQDKGKQRASTLPTPDSHDDADAVRGQKRKRQAPATMTQEDVDEDDKKFTRWYDPNQAPEVRRDTKRQTRELERQYHENREELRKDTGRRLAETVLTADKIFMNVKQTGDAMPDSRLLVNIGDMAYKRSAALVSDDRSIGIDVDEFLSKALAMMKQDGSSTQRQTQRDPNDSENEDDSTPLDWDLLGRHACYQYNSRPPVPSFLLGPLSREKKQRAPTQRRAREKNTATEARPEALTSQDLTQSDQNSLTTQCREIRQHLKARVRTRLQALHNEGIRTEDDAATTRGKALLQEVGLRHVAGQPGLPLFEYVINPNSFGQTIENMFYVSFLIKEGVVGLGIDPDGLPVLHTANAHSLEEQRANNISKHQAVLSLDYQTWKDLIKAYNITESMIPHREESQTTQLGSRGWYS